MDESMKQLLEECEEILLEVQILGEDFPKIKELYNNALILFEKLEKSAKSHISDIDLRTSEVQKGIKQQEKHLKQTEKAIEDLNNNLDRLSGFVERIEALHDEHQRLSQSLVNNIKKVEELSAQYKKVILNAPSVPAPTTDIYKMKIDKLEKEIDELKKWIKKSVGETATGSSSNTVSDIKKRYGIPSNAKKITLDDEPNCTHHKPYGVFINDVYLESDAWTTLMENFAIYCFNKYDKKNEVVDLAKAGFEDGFGHEYFIKGAGGGSNYNYLSQYKISLYKPGADGTVKMMQALCHYYSIDSSKVMLFFYKK